MNLRGVILLLLGGCTGIGCGGRADADADGAGTAPTVGGAPSKGGAPSTSDTSDPGGTTSTSSTGGMSTGGTATCLGSTVTIEAVPSPTIPFRSCLGKPGQCATQSGSLGDPEHPFALSALCSIDCQTCQMNDCHSILCIEAGGNTEPVVLLVWDGTYYESSSRICGDASRACATKRCAQPGTYTFTYYTYPNPTPGSASGCSLTPIDATAIARTTTFYYPSDSEVIVEY